MARAALLRMADVEKISRCSPGLLRAIDAAEMVMYFRHFVHAFSSLWSYIFVISPPLPSREAVGMYVPGMYSGIYEVSSRARWPLQKCSYLLQACLRGGWGIQRAPGDGCDD